MNCNKCPVQDYCKANIVGKWEQEEISRYKLCPLINLLKEYRKKDLAKRRLAMIKDDIQNERMEKRWSQV